MHPAGPVGANRVLAAALAGCVLGVVLSAASPARAAADPGAPAARLLAGYALSRDGRADNPFRRPLYLTSTESEGGVSGEVYALLEQPFAVVAPALARAADWCEILTLHPNTKYCRASGADPAALDVRIGSKRDVPLDRANRLAFAYRVTARGADFLAVRLDAPDGPFDTRDYRIVLEAAPTPEGRTVVRLAYSYGYGPVGRLAMQVYLATAGRGKVGFTIDGRQSDGEPRYVAGIRGVVERNTLRYGLAIEAFFRAAALAPTARREQSLRDWFAATERHPRQLHEMDLGEYLALKRREYARQQEGPGQ